MSSHISEVFKLFRTQVTCIHLISMFGFFVPLMMGLPFVILITIVAYVRIRLTNYLLGINSNFNVIHLCYLPARRRPLHFQIAILKVYNLVFFADFVIFSVCSLSLKVWQNFSTLVTIKMITK